MDELERLLGGARLEGARRPLGRAETLPPEAYTSPEVYAQEEARIFRREWLCAGRLDQVPEPGDYVALDLLGHKLVMVRGEDRRVRVLSRVCRHRAAELVQGRGRARSFPCPYHRWTYGLDGSLLGAPLMDEVDLDRAACRLPALRTEVWAGWLFVCLDPEAPPLAPRLAGLEALVADYRLEDMVADEPLVYDSPFNWKVLVENFMEAYHHVGTHRDTLEPLFPARAASVPDNGGEPWSLLRMPPAASGAPEEGLPPIEGLPEARRGELLAVCVPPCHLFALTDASLAWYQLLPDAAARFALRIHTCVPRRVHEDPALEGPRRALRELTALVHGQDIGACEAVWSGLHSRDAAPGRLHRLEAAIWQQNQWWIARMRERGAA